MLCRRVRLYSTLEAPGLIMLAQPFCLLSAARSLHLQPPFWVAIKDRRIKGRVHRRCMLVAFCFCTHMCRCCKTSTTNIIPPPTRPQHTASWFPAPLSAQHILIVSKPFGKSTPCWVSEATDTPCHLPHRDSRSTMLIFIMKRPEKNQS